MNLEMTRSAPIGFTLVGLLFAGSVMAQTPTGLSRYLTPMDTPEIREMTEEELQEQIQSPSATLQRYFDERMYDHLSTSVSETDGTDVLPAVDVILDQIINIGKKIWALIEKKKPVVNLGTDVAYAMPQGITRWDQLSGWQVPGSKVYGITYKNGYGMEVVKFSFRVLYTYGGNLNGKGKYLSQVTILPAVLDVSWGFEFNAQASVPSVLNAGTTGDPMGAMELRLQWRVNTILQHRERSNSYFVRGDGQFTDLTLGK